MRIRLALSIAFFLPTLFGPTAVAQPSHVSYQGSLLENGNPYTGSADFKFAIVDGGATLWSNDGTSVSGSEPTASVTLSVDQGVFTVFLGQGMDPLTSAVLEGSAAPVLRVWVDTGGGFDQLSDQTISSSAFALHSESADRAPGAFTANGMIHSTTDGYMFPDSTVQTTSGGLPAGAGSQTLRHDGAAWVADGTLLNDGTNVGIGIGPTADRRINVNTDQTYGVYAVSSDPAGRGLYGRASSSTGATYGVLGTNSSNDTNSAGVYGTGYRGVRGYSINSGFAIGVYGETSYSGVDTNVGGYFIARGTTGQAVFGRSTSTAVAVNYGGRFIADGYYGQGVYGLANDSGSGTKYGGYFQANGTNGRGVFGLSTSSSGYGVYSSGRLRASSSLTTSPDGWLNYIETTGTLAINSNLLELQMPLTSDTEANFIDAQTDDNDSKFTVERTGIVRADSSIYAAAHLTGAADFAEMLFGSDGLEPGDVLVISPARELARSTGPLQTNVVGVRSTRPGFVGGAGSEEEMVGKVPLAVVGIVPVKATTENGPILPGDLMVTSGVSGHAMRYDNPPPGTIVGKALEGLTAGTGVIKMLVTLQ